MALTAEDGRVLRPFAETLRHIRKGKLAEELAEHIADLLLAVDETDKAGTLTLTLAASPIKNSGAIQLVDKIVVKLPEADKPATIVFPDAAGNPVRNDPRQQELEGLHEVPAEPVDASSLSEAK